MFSTDITFVLKNVARSKTAIYKEVYDRKYSSFYYKFSGSVDYQVNGTHFLLEKGDILFIPAHAHYIVRTITEGEYISVHFDSAEMEQLPPKQYGASFHVDTGALFSDIWHYRVTERDENVFMCYAKIYQLLSHLTAYEKSGYTPQSKYALIAPSVQYMENHLFDENLKITDLHIPSGISYVYFERLFKLFFQMSPAKYMMHKRLAYAKSSFDSGDFISVAQVAADVGYTDPLYFSKLFKRQTGISPRNYIKNERL